MALVRIDLCERCVTKLRTILDSKGQNAMCEAMGRVLCTTCKKQLPGYAPGAELVTRRKPLTN